MTTPGHPIRLVHVEADPGVSERVRASLAAEGLECVVERVDQERALVGAVEGHPPDLILADLELPAFSGLRALEVRQRLCPATPFIYLTDTGDVELAVDALRQGATDFVLRSSLKRLPAAVRRALDEARGHHEKLKLQEEHRGILRYFEVLDRVNRAIQGTDDVDRMMGDVLELMLAEFHCERAWLVYPCDADAPSRRTPMERTQPECRSVGSAADMLGEPDAVGLLREICASGEPVAYDPQSGRALPRAVVERYDVQSLIAMELRPKSSERWMFGLHQCSHARVWSRDDQRLFQEIGRRLADGLTILLTMRRERDASARVGEILESITDAFIAMDRDWRYTYVNEIAARTIGESRETLVGQQVWERRPDMIGTEIETHLRRAMTDRVPSHFECFVPAAERWFECHAFPTRDGLSLYTADITQRKRAAAELTRQMRMNEAMFSQAITNFVLMDPGGRVIRVNDAFASYYQKRADELVGTDVLDLRSVGRPPDVDSSILETVVESKEPWRHPAVPYEFAEQPARGVTYFDMTLQPILDERGDVEFLFLSAIDVTERRRTEETLLWRTAFFEAQVESAVDGILVVDAAGRKILQNERMNELWKIPRHVADDVDDTAQLQYVTGRTKNPTEFARKVAYLYSHPDEVSQDEVELDDGTVLERYSSPVRDRNGKHYGRIWTFRDITARRTLEEQFRQAQKMEAIGQLAGGIAHDFNNLLSVIQMQSSMLLPLPSSELEIKEGIQEIMSAAERAANLTRQLLTFSRRGVSEAKAVDITEIADSMSRLFRRLLPDDITLQTRFAPELPWISADAGMMEQVLMNLAVNARDAMPTGGRMVVSLERVELGEEHPRQHPRARPGRFVRLDVSDTGCGMPPENISRIFEPFFTTKEVGKGTGLGLASVFGIVEQHQGWIEVASEVGHGTTFHVYLPALERTAEQEERAAGQTRALGGTETILLVEDDPSVRHLVCAVLERHGYRVLEAGSAAAALARWENRASPIELLLTDLVMPGGMSGHELATALLAREPTLKVVYTSGYSNDIVSRQLDLEPGRNFLQKPCSAYELASTVRRRLDEV